MKKTAVLFGAAALWCVPYLAKAQSADERLRAIYTEEWKWRLEQFHGVEQFCTSHNIDLTSAPALLGVELCVYAVATILFVTVERPFSQLRRRIAPRSSPAAAGK
jgi:hypothetical protein